MAGQTGFEPVISSVTGRRDNQVTLLAQSLRNITKLSDKLKLINRLGADGWIRTSDLGLMKTSLCH